MSCEPGTYWASTEAFHKNKLLVIKIVDEHKCTFVISWDKPYGFSARYDSNVILEYFTPIPEWMANDPEVIRLYLNL